MEDHTIVRTSYVKYHEQLMQNNTGTTTAETFLVLIPMPITIYLTGNIILFSLNCGIDITKNKISMLFVDFVVIVVPFVLSLTLLADLCLVLVTTMLCVSVALSITIIASRKAKGKILSASNILSLPMQTGKKAFITNFRAMINLITAICILSVDFKIFPRRYAKTETYGLAVMDVGVGGFVLANAIVSREARMSDEGQLHKSFGNMVLNEVRGCLPLCILGASRFFIINQVDYQQHVTEYGVQWNFFVTLLVTKITCEVLLFFITAEHSVVFSLFLIGLHELQLSLGIRNWILSDAPRNDFLSANREGIVSCLGYFALYFAGVGLGKYLHRERVLTQEWIKSLVKLTIEATILWTCTIFSNKLIGISRRLANAGYYFWILALCVTLLDLLLIVEIVLNATWILLKGNPSEGKERLDAGISETEMALVPKLLQSINYNGLFFFLLSNVLTGLINLSTYTLYKDSVTSFIIICCYMFLCCAIVNVLHNRNIQIKLW